MLTSISLANIISHFDPVISYDNTKWLTEKYDSESMRLTCLIETDVKENGKKIRTPIHICNQDYRVRTLIGLVNKSYGKSCWIWDHKNGAETVIYTGWLADNITISQTSYQ